ncbi:type II toxin-antitoxin system Phd/YefM family antitoxin [Candidatus Gottesmanbacteria bacterium]|nr:type II toxin-antitoxin system Phd/YefM family antitoxin [Candidatus Gottesmanbacteria bacterium]
MSTLSTTIPASEARTNFYKILEAVGEKLCQFTITLRGKAQAVIMPAEEVTSWQETLEIASDKKLVESIKRGLKGKKIYSQKEADKVIDW